MLRGASPSVRTFASLAMPTTSQGGSSSRSQNVTAVRSTPQRSIECHDYPVLLG